MYNIVLAQGAEHTEHDKLLLIANNVLKHLSIMRTQDASVGAIVEAHRITGIYNNSKELIIPRYADVEWVDEEKIDGFSYTADNGRFFSRKLSEAKGSEGMPVEKTDHVPHLASTLKELSELADADFHGELFIPGGESDDVTRIMGCSADKAIQRQLLRENRLHYMIHDIRRYNGKSLINEPWYVRRALLEHIFNEYGSVLYNGFIHLSKIIDNPFTAFNGIILRHGEGLMFKRTHALYVPGKKPANNWVKCKKEITLDVVIMGLDYNGTGKNKDLFRSLDIGLVRDGGGIVKVGNVHSGISDGLRRKIYENPSEYINKVIEVDAMEFSNTSWSLRHARLIRFRDDKSPMDCTSDGIKVKEVI